MTTTLTEYQNLVIQHAELRALRVRLNGGGIFPEGEIDARVDGLITSAMQEADDAGSLTPEEIKILARGLRYSIGHLTAMPQEGLAETQARFGEAARRLRRVIDSGQSLVADAGADAIAMTNDKSASCGDCGGELVKHCSGCSAMYCPVCDDEEDF